MPSSAKTEPPGQAHEAPAETHDRFSSEGELPYQQCAGCARVFYPPRVLCPTCGSQDVPWMVSGGSGTIYSCTTIAPRGADAYTVAIIDVDEGFRIMAQVAPADAAIGTRVQWRRDAEVETPIFDIIGKGVLA